MTDQRLALTERRARHNTADSARPGTAPSELNHAWQRALGVGADAVTTWLTTSTGSYR